MGGIFNVLRFLVGLFIKVVGNFAVIGQIVVVILGLFKKKTVKHTNIPATSILSTQIICPDCTAIVQYDKLIDKFFCAGCKKVYEIALIEVDTLGVTH
jgi:hypothetical protein